MYVLFRQTLSLSKVSLYVVDLFEIDEPSAPALSKDLETMTLSVSKISLSLILYR